MRYVLGAVAFLLFSAEAYAQCPCPCQCQQRQYQQQTDDGWDPPQYGRRPQLRQSARDVTRIEGDITPRTLDEFQPAKVVILNSPGGMVEPAIDIAEQVRRAGSTTVVPYGARCESACAIIWVAAEHRLMAGQVGFHAPFNLDEDEYGRRGKVPAPGGEQLIASSYERWGLSEDFTQWSMQRNMHYLTPELARRFDIKLDTNIPADVADSRQSPTSLSLALEDIGARLDRLGQRLSRPRW